MITAYDGFILINKPIGPTSFDAVHKVRKLSSVKKVGHCGTLDPFADGLLILAIGRQFTRQIDHFQDLPKTYRFTMKLGSETDTLDPTGEIIHTDSGPFEHITEDLVRNTLQAFLGEQSQTPPQFSAKKINGERAYKLARKGEVAELKPHAITIHSLEFLSLQNRETPLIECRVHCSKGTYIRSLVKDIAHTLNTVAHTSALTREKIGDYDVNDSLNLDTLTSDLIHKHRFMIK